MNFFNGQKFKAKPVDGDPLTIKQWEKVFQEFNLKITDMQAAIGLSQLDKIEKFTEIRRENFSYLYKRLEKFEHYFILPEATEKSNPSWFGFPLIVKENAPFSKNDVVIHLAKNLIDTRSIFAGNLVKQPFLKDNKYRVHNDLINSDLIMNNSFWLESFLALLKKC